MNKKIKITLIITIINIDKTKYVIPEYSSYLNRYYIDKSGKIYSVSDLINSKTEKYIKELIDYKEE